VSSSRSMPEMVPSRRAGGLRPVVVTSGEDILATVEPGLGDHLRPEHVDVGLVAEPGRIAGASARVPGSSGPPPPQSNRLTVDCQFPVAPADCRAGLLVKEAP
jgi:hypothetical protein